MDMAGSETSPDAAPGPHPDLSMPTAGEEPVSVQVLAELSDEELFRRMQNRDESALVALYERYAGLVMALALRVVGDRELSEEIVQDTFLRCWNGADSYHPDRGRVLTWLMGVARNRAIDALRSKQHHSRLREQTDLDSAPPAKGGIKDETEAVILRQVVAEAMHSLPTAQRQVIELAYYGGLTQAEIAGRLGEPLGTVKTRTRMAMEKLRGLLRPYFYGAEPWGREQREQQEQREQTVPAGQTDAGSSGQAPGHSPLTMAAEHPDKLTADD